MRASHTIGIIGTYPPPYGGRSIHVQRLIDFIAKSETYKILVFDFTKIKEVRRNKKVIIFPFKRNLRLISNLIRILFSVDIIHCQQPLFLDWLLRVIIIALEMFGKKVIISLHHSATEMKMDYGQMRSLNRWITRFALFKANFVVATNDNVKSFISSLGIPAWKIVTIPSFIPPLNKNEDYNAVPTYIWNFISIHKPVIGASASFIRLKEGVDVYGLDMMVDLINRLKDKWPNIGLVIMLAKVNNISYLNEIKRRIKENHLEKNILINTKAVQAYPVWKHVDVFIRPTSMDATPISMWEALWLRTPVIASDCANRPMNVVTFQSRNIDSLVKKTEMVIRNYRGHKRKAKLMTKHNNAKEIIRLYERASTY